MIDDACCLLLCEQAVWEETKECMRIPTFWVIVAQGCFGSTPWYAQAYIKPD